MSLYEGVKIRVRADSELSEEIKWGCTKYLCGHLFNLQLWYCHCHWPVGVLKELLYADDIVRMSETIKGLSNTSVKWMEASKSRV